MRKDSDMALAPVVKVVPDAVRARHAKERGSPREVVSPRGRAASSFSGAVAAQKNRKDIPTNSTSIGLGCFGSLLAIDIWSRSKPWRTGAYSTTTIFEAPGESVNVPPPLTIENGGLCRGAPTVTCKGPLPVFLIVTLWRSVE
jgi:hypothetical protein